MKNSIASKSLTKRAENIAKRLHHKQLYGKHPYSKHLHDVVAIAQSHNLKESVIAACWLHDTMEDCGYKYKDIKQEFNKEIAEMVYCVTDELGRNRKERKQKTYPKLAKNESAIQVKLCDRIANLAQSIQDKNLGLTKMYYKEHKEFKQQLYQHPNPTTQKLWNQLEELAQQAKLK